MRNTHCRIWYMGRNNEKHWKWEMHSIEHGIWTEKNEKCWKWEMDSVEHGLWTETLNNMEYEKRTLEIRVYCQKNWKKMENLNAHCRTWYMARNAEKHGNWETHTVEHVIWVSCTDKHGKRGKHTVEHGIWVSCTEKHGKWETHTVEHAIWASYNEKHRKWEMHIVEHGI